ncbi:hypothetical protein PPSIR1_05548 [Plesiocystis pacifica SIR-1]|uniref:LTD domain-containing protein n=1 Tax=Plesiocystis pacifica SIR-1 TaxID=391625 RepID=A6FX82_9BACT|nr:lamin tail domain-containing protein [Plesiocystis pacifica]EDM81906.1 hypothetical protein PPSIR1_05548 [Plesiocystis pacifica SIR-1]
MKLSHGTRPSPARRLAYSGLALLAACSLTACPEDDVEPCADDEAGDSCELPALLPGDLVLSEVLANPAGADDGLEWFEIYNASGEEQDLEGLTLVYSKTDGSGVKTHVINRTLLVPAGGYVVVADMLDEVAEVMGHVDYGYAGELGSFGNSGGYLAVDAGETVIDEIYYAEPTEGASRIFDGSQAPDAVANDNLGSWCDSTAVFAEDLLATPGAPNDVCGSADTCLIDGAPVDVVRPAPGDLVITEVLPNPDASPDETGEWFELQVNADVHLNGLEIGKSLEDEADELIASADCVAVSAGSHVVIAKSALAEENGALPEGAVVATMGVSLTNSDSSLWIGSEGALIDAVSWGSSPTGASLQIPAEHSSAEGNDDPELWCESENAWGEATDAGTPGAPDDCPQPPPPEGQCYEGGELRDIQPVEAGGLLINELMPNPDAVDDADGEYFELLVTAAGDLNGLRAGKEGALQDPLIRPGDVDPHACVPVTAGQLVLVAREADSAVNGMLPEVDLLFDFALNNSNSDLVIGYEAVDDSYAYSSSEAGMAISLDPNTLEWCDAAPTPKAVNASCGGSPMGQCLDPQLMMLRNAVPPEMGDLVINEIMPNPDAVTDANGEWFELYAAGAFDLNGVQIGKGGQLTEPIESETCIEIEAGAHVVLAKSDDPGTNGGLPVVHAVMELSLSNSNTSLDVGYGGVIYDSVMWSSSPTGAAHSLDPGSQDPALNDDADDLPWCPAVDVYGMLIDLGTPGEPNPMCGMGGGGMMDDQCIDNGEPRAIVYANPGDLILSEYMANPAAVGDTAGEWFEVRALAAVDLNGVDIGRTFPEVMDSVDANTCIPLSPGDTALVARNGDSMVNGGLPPVDFETSVGLNNSNSGLFLARGGELIDQVTWTSVSAGKSESLDPGSYDAAANDAAASWCDGAVPYGDGDEGTPKADNPGCN